MFTTHLRSSESQQFTDRQRRIHDFLSQQHVGVLSTVTPDNDPHGAVVYYCLGEDFTICLLTKKGTRKYDNIMHNNHVMMTVFEPASQAIAQILGIATEYSAAKEVTEISNKIFKRMMQSHDNQLPPLVKLQAGAFTAFVIEPVQIRMAVYSRPDSGDYNELFESIESFELADE